MGLDCLSVRFPRDPARLVLRVARVTRWSKRQRSARVFLSYRSTDREVVEEFAGRLRRDGMDAWYDGWEIAPGDASWRGWTRALTAAERV